MLYKILPLLVVQVPLPRGAFLYHRTVCQVSGWIHGSTAEDEWNSFNLPSLLAAPSPQQSVVGRTRAQLLCNSTFWTTSRGTTNKHFCHSSFKWICLFFCHWPIDMIYFSVTRTAQCNSPLKTAQFFRQRTFYTQLEGLHLETVRKQIENYHADMMWMHLPHPMLCLLIMSGELVTGCESSSKYC